MAQRRGSGNPYGGGGSSASSGTPVKGRKLIVDENFFVDKLLPMMTMRTLTAEEMDNYREPFLTPESRRPAQVWPREVPLDGDPPDVHARLRDASKWLQSSRIPKLLLWMKPGAIIRRKHVKWFCREVPNLEDVYLGKGLHYIQEDHPAAIGDAIANWLARVARPASRAQRSRVDIRWELRREADRNWIKGNPDAVIAARE